MDPVAGPMIGVVRFLHLVAAATWVGGIIVLAPLIIALRRAGADREVIRAAARTFSRVTWMAMAVAIATGVTQVSLLHWPLADPGLRWKLAAVGSTVAIAGFHQLTAARSLPAPVARGVEVAVLVASLAVVAAAVRL